MATGGSPSSTRSTPSPVRRRRTTDGVGRRPAGAPTRSTVTHGAAAHGPMPSATPSTTTSRCGPAASSDHQRRSSSTSGVNIRSGPAPSRSRGWALCGSHLAHSHAANTDGAATTATRASAGLCHSTNCATTALASARAAVAVGFEPDRGRLLQRQGDRQFRHHGVRLQEAAQRERGDRLQALGRPGLRRDEAGGEALGAAADAHVCEVGIGRAAFPQPPARDDGGPRFGLGMRGLRGDPLRGRCLLHRAPHLAEVAQVVAAPLVDGGRPRRTPAPPAGGHHAERRDREHAAEQPRRGVADAEDDDEAQRPGQHHQRQQPHQHAAGHHLLRLRWRLERQLARRWGWQLAVGPCDLDGAHEFLQTAPRGGPRRRC